MSLLRKGILAGGGSVVGAISGLVANMCLSRALLPEGMGRYQIPFTAGVLIVTILSFGIGQSNIFFLNRHKIELKKIVMNSFWFSCFNMVLLIIILPSILSFFRGYFGDLTLWTRILFSIGLGSLLAFTLFRPILTAQLRIVQDISSQLFNRVSFLIFIVVGFLLNILTVEIALAAISVSYVASLLWVVWCIKSSIDFRISFSFGLFLNSLRYGLKIFAANFVYMVNISLGLMLLRYLLPNDFASIGHYSRAVSLGSLIMLIPTAVGPLLYAQWSDISALDRKKQVELAMRLHIMLALGIIVVIIIFAPLFITILYGKEFLPAVPVLRMLIFAIGFRCIFNVCHNLFTSDGFVHATTVIYGISMIVTATLTWLFVPKYGIMGPALADMISSLFVALAGLLILKLKYDLPLNRLLIIRVHDIIYVIKTILRKNIKSEYIVENAYTKSH